MSTDESNEQGAPERLTSATDDEDDTEGHRLTSQSADPDFRSRAAERLTSATEDSDDVEGHRLTS